MKLITTKFGQHAAIEFSTSKLKSIIITDCGPRIAFFGSLNGDNLLFWDNTNRSRSDWKLMGGHRVWAARPGADEAEETYLPDNEPCEIETNYNAVTVLGAINPTIKIQKSIKIEIVDENKLIIDNIITNKGAMLYSGSVWGLTCTNPNPNRQYGIPLGDNSAWDCFKIVYFRKWAGVNTSPINDPQISFTEDMLLLNPQGIMTKRMVEAPFGIMAMDVPDQNTMFIKKIPYEANSKYPLGCNLAFYVGVDNFMVEMESLGAETTLKPGQSAVLREIWQLTEQSYALEAKNLIDLTK